MLSNRNCEHEFGSRVKVCVCTNDWLGFYHGGVERIVGFAKALSRHGADVYLVDRSIKKSLSALLIDNDKYFKVAGGQLKEIKYPFHMRFLFPGIIKFLQESFAILFGLLTCSNISEVSLFKTVDP